MWEHLKTPNVFSTVQQLTITPGPLKECDSLWSEESMRVLIQVEDIMNICCEL